MPTKAPKSVKVVLTVGVEGRTTIPLKVRNLLGVYMGEKIEVTIRRLPPSEATAGPVTTSTTSDGESNLTIGPSATFAATPTYAYALPTTPAYTPPPPFVD
jgi:hypothetical protein